MRAYLLLVCVAVSGLVSGQSQYDALKNPCKVYGCLDGSCAADGSGCETCNAGNYGPQCLTGGGVCAVTCVTENTEKDGGGVDQCTVAGDCICMKGWTGQDCGTKMIDVSCTQAGGVTVAVTPYKDQTGDFAGFMYLSTTKDDAFFTTDAACMSAAPGDDTFTHTIPLTDTSSCALNDEGSSTYTVYLYIQYKEDFRVYEDDVYTVTCVIGQGAGPNDINIGSAVSVGPEDLSARDVRLSTYDEDGAYSMILKDGDGGADVTPPVLVGHDLSVIVQHPTLFHLKRCTGYNYDPAGAAPADGKSVDLIVDWCVPNNALALIRAAIVYNDGTAAAAEGGVDGEHLLRIPINAWYFLGASSDIWIQCTGCIGFADAACAYTLPITCNNNLLDAMHTTMPDPTVRRKRRQAGDEDAVGTLAVSVKVTTRGGALNGTDIIRIQGESDNTDCYSEISVILPIILLAILLLIAMVMTFFFCLKLTRIQERRDGETNMAYKS